MDLLTTLCFRSSTIDSAAMLKGIVYPKIYSLSDVQFPTFFQIFSAEERNSYGFEITRWRVTVMITEVSFWGDLSL